jgi:hypothetical protein
VSEHAAIPNRTAIFGLQGGKPMTFDQCQQALVSIRRKQGTRYPVVRVDYGGTVFRGRLARADSDPEFRHDAHSPYGVLVLEQLGLSRGPETILQIANIPQDGLKPLDEK